MLAAWFCAGCHQIRGAGFVPFTTHPGAGHVGRRGDKWYPQNSAHLQERWPLLVICRWYSRSARLSLALLLPREVQLGACRDSTGPGGERGRRKQESRVRREGQEHAAGREGGWRAQ